MPGRAGCTDYFSHDSKQQTWGLLVPTGRLCFAALGAAMLEVALDAASWWCANGGYGADKWRPVHFKMRLATVHSEWSAGDKSDQSCSCEAWKLLFSKFWFSAMLQGKKDGDALDHCTTLIRTANNLGKIFSTFTREALYAGGKNDVRCLRQRR